MKPFSLEEFKAGLPAITRNGKKAYFIAHNPAFVDNQRLCFIVEDRKEFFTACEDGMYFRSYGEHYLDLVGMAPVKRTLWINLGRTHKAQRVPSSAYTYGSKEAADEYALSDRVGGRAWPLEIEE